jgi:hypothetical protein
MATYGPKAVAAPAGAIIVHPGDDVTAIVNSAPAGATFYFEAGVYRGLSLAPKDGQTFIGAEGAVINGSELLTGFTSEGSHWVIGGQTQEGLRVATDLGDGVSMRPGYPETVFIDDQPMKPVDSLSKLVSGTFYFDYAADRIYIADDPTGRKVEAGKLDHAFEGSADGVTVQNFVIEKYNPPTQQAAIQADQSWTIQDNEIRLNYALGVHTMGNSKIVGNYVHDNGNMGIGATGSDVLVEGNEIAHNGWWSGIQVFWEGGGSKFAYTDRLVVRDNYSHDNHGFGLWTDIDNVNSLYENNVVVDNSGGGITHEISYDATIRNNVLIGNGYESQGDGWMWGGQIQIQNSQNVDIYGNRVDMSGADGGNGIALIQQSRGSGAYGAYTTTGNSIHDNTIVSTDGNGKIGGAADFNASGMLYGGNVWSNNHYYLSGDNQFAWGAADTLAEFQAATGETGTVSQAYPDTSSWMSGMPVDDANAPVIAIDTVEGDDVLSFPETQGGLQVSGTATGADGQTIEVGVYDGLNNPVFTETATVAADGTWNVTFDQTDAQTLTGHDYSIRATVADAAGNTAEAEHDFTSTVCFMPGTMIRTPDGEVAVETLKRGDLVLTADNRAEPVVWIGRQTVSRLFSNPARVWPIRIRTGALGENVPSRDLLISPDHAILVDGILVQAGALVNGLSVTREDKVPATFTYYHVETGDHSLILAENVPAETFVDNADRLGFDNWDEHQAIYPEGKAIVEMPYPRAQSARQIPQAIRERLSQRAAELLGEGSAAAA